MLPIVAGTLVKANTSSAVANPPVIDTDPLTKVALSGSATVITVSIAVAAWFSVYARVDPVVSTGASFTPVTLIANDVDPIFPPAPSLTVKVKLSEVVSEPLCV